MAGNYQKERQAAWNGLHERGVMLEDEILDYLTETIDRGITLAKIYLGHPEHRALFIFSDNLDRIGYIPELLAINIPVAYLNLIARCSIPLHLLPESRQLIGFDGKKVEVSFEKFLLAAGIEETIHYFQDIGDPKLKGRIPSEESYQTLDERTKILSQHEVEARTITDQIFRENQMEPIWEELDQYLKKTFPERYGQPVE